MAHSTASKKAAIMIPAIGEDGSLFPIDKLEAHEKAQLHLAISVFIFDGDHLLIQQRARSKYHCGGLWANTCCSHPHWNESLDAAAARRLDEELGFRLPLRSVGQTDYEADVGGGLTEHERVTLFTGSADRDALELRPDPEEVEATRWVSIPDLTLAMGKNPEQFAPWFRIYLERFPGLDFRNSG